MPGSAVISGRRRGDLFAWFKRNKDLGPIFIRLWVGWHLIYGTQDNILNWERMLEFQGFLTQHGFPWPMLSAVVSVYAQFLCGVLYLGGLFTRPAAAIMIFNFIVALAMVHLGDPYPGSALAFAMLTGSLFLLFNGPGRWALDNLRSRRE